jgi:hypothetical protein
MATIATLMYIFQLLRNVYYDLLFTENHNSYLLAILLLEFLCVLAILRFELWGCLLLGRCSTCLVISALVIFQTGSQYFFSQD